MTNEELKTYYADLLIAQYKEKAKAYATIKAAIEIIIMNQLPLTVRDAYNLDTAVGSQLDTLGKYFNVTRNSYGPNGPFTLDDTDFRSLIKMSVVKNSSDSSLATIQSLLNKYFPNQIQVFDNQKMQIHYLVDIGNQNLIYAFINELLLPRPLAVELTGVFYVPDLTKVFGYRSYNSAGIRIGLNSYTDYDSTIHWLSNKDIF